MQSEPIYQSILLLVGVTDGWGYSWLEDRGVRTKE